MPNPTPPVWRKDVVLTDGTSLRLRPMAPTDDQQLRRFVERLSPATL
ncbi:MAG: hypothetical protein HY423_05365, partial [Candidatus Lambdaproteobacteria bacterium]|nr:hypothetical protein [Candidatus Lambdaproteobacteria bacterium]